MADITRIPAPRVPFIDERTGLISREWYRFFLNLFTLVGAGTVQPSIEDLEVAPLPQNGAGFDALAQNAQLASALTRYDDLIGSLLQLAETAPPLMVASSANDVTPPAQSFTTEPQVLAWLNANS